MNEYLSKHPAVARVAPFALFLILTGIQNQFAGEGRFWMYLVKVIVGAGAIYAIRDTVKEYQWRFSLWSIAGGVLVFILWVGMDGFYPKWGQTSPWNPNTVFGAGSLLAWVFIIVRLAGSTLVVPPLEEIFYRSFIYRYAAQKDFMAVPLNRFIPFPFLFTAVLFAVEHQEWLPGLLAGFVYQGIVIRTGRLGDAIAAHALTNLLLGLWVIFRPAWNFW